MQAKAMRRFRRHGHKATARPGNGPHAQKLHAPELLPVPVAGIGRVKFHMEEPSPALGRGRLCFSVLQADTKADGMTAQGLDRDIAVVPRGNGLGDGEADAQPPPAVRAGSAR